MGPKITKYFEGENTWWTKRVELGDCSNYGVKLLKGFERHLKEQVALVQNKGQAS